MESEILILKKRNDDILCPYTTPNFPHRHLEWEFVVFDQGLSVNTVNENDYSPVGSGDIFVLGPMHRHAIRFLSEPHKHWDLYMNDADFKRQCAVLDDALYEQACSRDNPIHFKLTSQQATSLIEDFENLDILNALRRAKDDPTPSMSAIGRGLAGFLLAKYLESKLMLEIHTPQWFREFLYELRRPEVFSLRLNEIISGYNYSYPQFIRIFKKYTGKKMIEYVTELRMDYAADLLVSTDKTEMEIASLIGYDSFCFFLNRFKQKYGVTPRKYRQLLLQPESLPPEA